MFKMENINVPIIGLVENMSWFTPKNHPEEKYYIFGENGGEYLSKSLDISLLGKNTFSSKYSSRWRCWQTCSIAARNYCREIL